MSASIYVAKAAEWSGALIEAESRGHGDFDNAMRRVARRHKINHSTLWRLRYSPPKRIDAGVLLTLFIAHLDIERQHQAKRLKDEVALQGDSFLVSRIGRALAALAGAEIAGDDEA